MRITIKIILACLVLSLLIAILLSPLGLLIPLRVDVEEGIPDFSGGTTPQWYGLKADRLQINVDDGISLKGWYIHSVIKPAKGTIVAVHGMGRSKEYMLPHAEGLAKNNYNVVIFDLRAHGQSGGFFSTHGYYEHKDVSTVISYLETNYPDDLGPIGILGNSLGAAASLMAMASDKRISAGIVEGSYATFEDLACVFWGMLGITNKSLIQSTFPYLEAVGGFKVDHVKPVESARSITQPILVVQGTEDKLVPVESARRIYNNLASVQKYIYEVQGAGHTNLEEKYGDKYASDYVRFYDRWLAEQ